MSQSSWCYTEMGLHFAYFRRSGLEPRNRNIILYNIFMAISWFPVMCPSIPRDTAWIIRALTKTSGYTAAVCRGQTVRTESVDPFSLWEANLLHTFHIDNDFYFHSQTNRIEGLISFAFSHRDASVLWIFYFFMWERHSRTWMFSS